MLQENTFAHHISKDELQALPRMLFEGEIVLVESATQAREAMNELLQQTVVGVDTETRPSFEKGVIYPTSLVQVATETKVFLFRVNRKGVFEVLSQLFTESSIVKVGLAFNNDLIGLRRTEKMYKKEGEDRQKSFTPVNCVDIQKMVSKFGILDMSLQKIYAIIFGKCMSKSEQLTNWENVHLSEKQLRYAATDAWATLLIYKKLLQTEPLPQKNVTQLLTQEKERLQQHQREVEAAKIALQKENNETANQ